MVMHNIPDSQLRTLCILADDIGHSDVNLATRIGWTRGNFSKKVMSPLEDAGYVTYSQPQHFGKPKKLKELEDMTQQFKIPTERNEPEVMGIEINNRPRYPGRPRKLRYVNYDKEGILEMILKNITSELNEIRYKLPKVLKKKNELTRTFKKANGFESNSQIEKIKSDLDQAKSKFDQMVRDITFYNTAHKELMEKFFILQELDTEEPGTDSVCVFRE